MGKGAGLLAATLLKFPLDLVESLLETADFTVEFLDGTMQPPDLVSALMLFAFSVLTFGVLSFTVLTFSSIQAAVDLCSDLLQMAALFVKAPLVEVLNRLMEMLKSFSQVRVSPFSIPFMLAIPVAFALPVAFPRPVAFAIPVAFTLS